MRVNHRDKCAKGNYLTLKLGQEVLLECADIVPLAVTQHVHCLAGQLWCGGGEIRVVCSMYLMSCIVVSLSFEVRNQLAQLKEPSLCKKFVAWWRV